MMRALSILLGGLIGATLAVAVWAQVPGYPPLNSFQVGNDSVAPPSWKSLAQTQSILQLGSMAYQNANAVAITGGTATGLPSPSNSSDAATKGYVDNTTVGFTPHLQSRLTTTGPLPGNTYNNGTAGVGATLTASANGALSIDSTAVAVNDRAVVKNEAAAANNGIYVVTATGGAGAPYVLTRAADANAVGAGNANLLGFGTYSFVTAGALNANTGWMVNGTITTIGTTPVNWVQFNGGTASGVSALNGLLGQLTLTPAVSASGSVITLPGIQPQGRLTLQSGTPVMVTAQINKATLFYDCYHGGNVVPVYNGAVDLALPIGGCEISTAMQATGTGVVNNAGVFDVWAVNVSGALTLCVATNGSGGGWASDTAGSAIARGTGYSALDQTTRPYVTNKNALAHCYSGATDRGSVAANQATYLGSLYATANGQTGWGLGGLNIATPTITLGIWNAYNRVHVAAMASTSTSSWTNGGAARQAGGIAAWRAQYVAGLAEDMVTGDWQTLGQPGGNIPACFTWISLDVVSGTAASNTGFTIGSGIITSLVSHYAGVPGNGFHTLFPMESANGSFCTFYGTADANLSIALRM